MLILTLEEFIYKSNIENKAMSNIKIKDIGRNISLIPIEKEMRDQKRGNINDNKFNIIVNLHPTDGFIYKERKW